MKAEDLFVQFVKSLKDAEIIDELISSKKINTKIADYFFDSREIICEQKILKSDMTNKMEDEINKVMKDKNAPILLGKMPFDKIVEKFPNPEVVRQQVFQRLTKTIDGSFSKANKQILSTKKYYNLNNSKGILLILNEASYWFSPHIISYACSSLMAKKNERNSYRYSEIKAVWILQYSHFIKFSENNTSYPSTILFNNFVMNDDEIKQMNIQLGMLEQKYARFLEIPYMTTSRKFEEMNFTPHQMPTIDLS
ncbi:MAG: hypothetical protein RBU23_11575 [Candidatus Auribacterota bacterium]|jgi:hypothetical protein|nr:hypothetical protein [Candidatus Auribacterota bacterium]